MTPQHYAGAILCQLWKCSGALVFKVHPNIPEVSRSASRNFLPSQRIRFPGFATDSVAMKRITLNNK